MVKRIVALLMLFMAVGGAKIYAPVGALVDISHGEILRSNDF